jgi:hypothetical protein
MSEVFDGPTDKQSGGKATGDASHTISGGSGTTLGSGPEVDSGKGRSGQPTETARVNELLVEILRLQQENARLKAEVERLKRLTPQT